MTRNAELIERYERRINNIESELRALAISETTDNNRIIYLDCEICVYKLVIIDLQE